MLESHKIISVTGCYVPNCFFLLFLSEVGREEFS